MTWVHDQIYAAGGDHIPSNWASFVEQTGITAVLHLRPKSPSRFMGPPPMSFLWLDLEDESQAGLKERWLVGSFIGDHVKAGHRLLLHSSLRRHRIRWAYVAYMIWSGRSVRASLREAAQRPWLDPYHTDEDIWEEFKHFVMTRRFKENLSASSRAEH